MLCPNCNSEMAVSKESNKVIVLICTNCKTQVTMSNKQTTENFSEKKTMEDV